MQKAISIFLSSAGTLLLVLATALFLINCTSPIGLVTPHEPIFSISIRDLFWVVGGIFFLLALICLFAERPTLSISLLTLVTITFWNYRIGLLVNGCHNLKGFLGGFTFAFGISADIADMSFDMIFAFLLGGSCLALWAMRRLPRSVQSGK